MPTSARTPDAREADTERGDQLRCDMHQLERLVDAYQRNDLRPAGS